MSLRHPPQRSPNRDEVSKALFPGHGSPLAGPSARNSKAGGNSQLQLKIIMFAISLLSILMWRVALQNTPSIDAPATLIDAPAKANDRYNKLARALQKTPIGSLGPARTNRRRLRYYDSLFYAALQFGADASSVIEVGCSSDPFVQHLDWIDQRTCVAPYFIEYGDGKNNEINDNISTSNIQKVKADFMEYKLPHNQTFDLLLCNQVLEHVPDPAAFMKKLIPTAKTSIISVPYNWVDCGKVCNHVTHRINYDMLLEWGAPHEPIYRGIVSEDKPRGHQMSKRIILVYKNE